MARILLAEDDSAVRDFVRRALEMDGHDVTTVGRADEATTCYETVLGLPDEHDSHRVALEALEAQKVGTERP